jgi:hypothetical protein
MNLHFGCGLHQVPGWYNCDGSPTLWLQRLPIVGAIFQRIVPPRFPPEITYGNIVKGLPIPAESCDAIYCSHVLEHLSLEDCRTALGNTFRYLKRGGLFRCVLPDFEQQIQTYVKDPAPTASTEFLSYTFLGRKTRPRTAGEFIREMLGNSNHLWMWDYKGLAAELEGVGFTNIRRCELGDSPNPDFRQVETPGRYEWGLAIECGK